MRILGFSCKWDKLHLELPISERPDFTTFRYPRYDKDWQVNEQVQPVYKPRSKEREVLGIAEIMFKDRRRTICSIPNDAPQITDEEAREDGFADFADMYKWLVKTHGEVEATFTINKLTLRWWDENSP